MDILSRLQNLKDIAGLSNTGISELIGRSHATVRNWFNGSTEIPAVAIPELARLFNTTTEYILTGETGGLHGVVQEPGEEYALNNMRLPPDDAMRASVEALITMYHRIELLTKKTTVLEKKISDFETSKT